jgi:hypothetical protein
MTLTTNDGNALPGHGAGQPRSRADGPGAGRRSRRPLVWAVSVGMLGSSVLVSSVGAADSNSPTRPVASSEAATAQRRAGALVTAAPAPVHGVAPDGTVFDGTFTLRRFVDKGGVLYAVGRLEGRLGDRAVRDNVRLPINGATNALPGAGPTGPTGLMSPEQVVPTPGACDILTLNLGPLDLDLLGLRVALDEVNLLIEAVPGAGNLLGNLLCAVAGLLDGGFLGGLLSNLLASITALLNGLLGNV